MRERSRSPHLPRDARRLRRLDSLCDQFESAWRSGEIPAIDAYLSQIAADDRGALLAELLPLDLAYRRDRGAELIEQDYVRMCPEFAEQVTDVLRDWAARKEAESGETLLRSGTDSERGKSEPTAPNSSFGDYDLLEEIGRGGMGVVYKAYQRSLDRVVAIKTLAADPFARARAMERFVSEARLAATLHHPGIVPIYEIGERDGFPYFTMEYLEGQTLDAFVAGERASPVRIAELVAQVAEIVWFAHERGVLHRDLKPSNVIVSVDGRVRVMDFGLAKRMEDSDVPRTLAGDVLGTPSYMSPEQARGDWPRVDRRSDIYSLGAILYALLAGRPPHQHSSPIMTIVSVLQDSPTPLRALRPELDEDLELICLKCLAKDPGERYATVAELLEALAEWLRAPGASGRARRAAQRRRRIAVGTLGALAAALVVGGLVLTMSDRDVPVGDEAPESVHAPDAVRAPDFGAEPGPSAIVQRRTGRAARPGDLDETFGRQGVVQMPLGTAEGINDAYAVALQPDGKIVAAGQVTRMRGAYYMAVTRFLPDGQLDRSFNLTGKMLLWFGPFDDGITGHSLLVQPDGKIVFGGRAEVRSSGYDFGLARVLPDGTLDPTYGRQGLAAFNVGGKGTSDLQALALEPDGKIVAAGSTSVGPGEHAFSIVRFLPDGAVDLAFGDRGKTFVDFPGSFEEVTDLDLREDGRIVVVGRAGGATTTDVAVLRLLADGSRDEGFHGSGHVLLNYAEHESAHYVVLQGNKIVVHVSAQPNRVVRLLDDGTLDPQFGERDGQVILDFTCTGLAPDEAGNLIAVDPHFARLVVWSPDGKPLASYGSGEARVLDQAVSLRDLARAPDGTLILAGTVRKDLSSDWTVVRVLGPPEPKP